MFNLKHKLSSFFKGDRELSLWYIPILLIWMFVGMGEGARILLLPDPVTLFLQVFVQAVLIGTVFYAALRYLSKWLVFILVPPFGIVVELIWSRGDIAAFSAQWGIPQPLVIIFWAVAWCLYLIPPYFITKQWKNVPFMLIFLGIAAFVGGTSWSDALKLKALGVIGVISSIFLIASGVYYWYKRRYRKRKKYTKSTK